MVSTEAEPVDIQDLARRSMIDPLDQSVRDDRIALLRCFADSRAVKQKGSFIGRAS